MLVLLETAKAATTTTSAVMSTAKPVSATSLMFQLLIGLVVVLALIWVAARIARGRVGGLGASGKRRNGALVVVNRQTLGKGVHLALVKAGADMYLLGVTANQVTRLARYNPDPAEVVESTDDLPPLGAIGSGVAPAAFRLQTSIRALQERTLRRG